MFQVSCRLLKFQFKGHKGHRNFHFEGIYFKGHQGSVKPSKYIILRAFNTFFKGFDPWKKSTLLYKLIYMERSNAVSFLGYGYVYGWVWELLGRQTYVDDNCIGSSLFLALTNKKLESWVSQVAGAQNLGRSQRWRKSSILPGTCSCYEQELKIA